jgi:hypothetical protein
VSKIIDVKPDAKLYYLASCYTKYDGTLDEAYEDACKQGVLLAKAGIYTLGPIASSHGMVKYDAPNEHEFWLPWDAQMIRRSDGIIVCMMKNWEQSFGINWEIAYAKSIGKPVYYMTPNEVPNLGD